jgi:subtilase family serine protease
MSTTNPNVAEMEGTVSQIQNTLNTQIDSFSCNGSVFYSATSMAQLPQQFSNIQMIYGLENYDSQLGSLGAVPLYRTVGTVTPGQTTSNILYYSPSEIRQMYNATDLLKAGYNGHGVSIAIVDAYGDPYIQKELQNFSAEFGLPFYNGTLHIIPVGPYNATQGILTGWNVEIVLDVEWAHAMAPNATINLYVASDSGSYLFNAVLNATLGSDGTAYGVYNNNIISMSWGEPEKDFCTSNPTLYPWLDQVFQMDAALGITAFASSGDRGAYDQTFGQTSAYGGASYPSTDPYVTGVGGTSLYMNTTSGYYQFPYANATGTYGNETAWSWNNFLFYMWGTGGGWSTVFGQPSWQTGSGVVNNGERGAPDVAWDADPLTGVLVSVFDNYTKSYDYYPVGGTSVGSPCWAGSMALIDQKAGRSLGFINPTIYSILNNGAEYSKAFHDITVGNNNPNSATTGWDALTGVGSPNLGELANYLAPTGRVLVVVTNDFSKASGLGRAYAYGQVVNLTAVVANNGTISGPVTATITSSTGAMIASNIALNYSASSGAWLGSYKIKATDPSGECSVTVTAINASSSGEGYTTFAVGDSVTILNPSYFTRYFYQVGDTICVYSYVVNTTDYRVTNGSYTATFYLAQNQATLNGLGKVEGKVSLQYNSTDGLWEGNFSIRSGVDQGAWILVVNGTDLNGDKGSAYTWINVGLDVLLFTDSPTYVLRDTISIFTYPAYENWSEATTGTFTAVIYEGPTFVAKVPLAYNKSVTFWYCGFTTSAGSPTGFYTITVNGTDGEGNSGSSTTVVRVAQYSLSVKVIVSNQIVPPSNVNEASVLAKITYPNGAAMTVGNVIGIICLNLSGIGLYPVNWFPMTYNSKAGGFIAINLFYGMNASLIGNYTVYVLAYDASGNCGTAITSFYSLILSYSIQGGGTVYSAPTLLYISNGVNQTATLNASPETYYLDAGSSWSVTNPLVGSSSIERWIASQTTSGTAISSQTLVFVYHHQFSDTLSYSVSGRGSPTAPTFTANQFGSSHVQTLTTAPTGYWFDAGSSWNVSNPLSGSTSSERWQTNQATSGTLLSWSVTTLAFTYYNQYYCAISTSGLSSNYPATITFTQYGYSFNPTTSTMWNNWCDSASSLSITSTISGGTGERWITPSSTSWTVNSSTSSSMQYYHQFCDTLSYSISGGGSATAPIFTANSEGQQCSVTLTTSASGYWFDAGSSWNVSNPLSGSTSSERWQTNQATLGTISPFQSITLTYYHQYLVTASYSTSDSSIPSSNAVLSGTQYGSNSYQLNLITLNQTAWLDANTAWSINTPITAESGTERWSASNGTSGTVNGPLTINPKYWHQYLVMASYSTSDGSTPLDSVVLSGAQFGNPAFTLTLITSNQATWLDAGSSWSVNNPITAVSGTERWYAVSGTSESSLASAIVIAPSYYHQYVVSFKFKDSTGTNTITPAFFRMETNNFTVISVPSFELWLDSGSESQIYSVIWENMDVKPTSNVTYIVNAPLNETILDRVFNAKLLVTDYLGIPISGAKVTFTLANGTTIQSTTGSDGTASLPMIPLGTFHASISYLGTTTTVVGDASMQSVTKGKIFASYPTLSLIAVVVIAAVATFMLVRRRHSSPKQKNSGVPIQQNTPTSAVPSDFVHASRVKADSGLV